MRVIKYLGVNQIYQFRWIRKTTLVYSTQHAFSFEKKISSLYVGYRSPATTAHSPPSASAKRTSCRC